MPSHRAILDVFNFDSIKKKMPTYVEGYYSFNYPYIQLYGWYSSTICPDNRGSTVFIDQNTLLKFDHKLNFPDAIEYIYIYTSNLSSA